MTEESKSVTSVQGNDLESERLDFGDETFYYQIDSEYDQFLTRVQMSIVDDEKLSENMGQSTARIVGPSGCGKTTFARSVAFDVRIIDSLINEHDIPVWKMTMDELVLFHDIVMKGEKEGSGNKNLCPNDCGATEKSISERKTKDPTYRCNNCGETFDEMKEVELDDDYWDQLMEVNSTKDELYDRGLFTKKGEPTDSYPNSRAEVYRELYKVYEGEDFESAPHFEITLSHAKYAKDLIGHPHIGDNGTTFIKGKVSKAVEASQDEVSVLVLDEVNRAPTSAKDELYDALDGRVKVSMDELGGVEIKGSVENLIIISTMNQGPGHHVEPMDFAEKRRHSSTYSVDFLGRENPDREAQLITENTPVNMELAKKLVKTANEVRDTAEDKSTDLSYGVPTGTLLEWARDAYSNYMAGIENPVISAGESTVARAIYDHDQQEVSTVSAIISKNLDGVSLIKENTGVISESEESEESENTSKATEPRYVCKFSEESGCSWSARESEIDEKTIKFRSCPECEGQIVKEE